MADFIVSPSQIFDVGVLSVKQFGSKYKVIWSKAVRKKVFSLLMIPLMIKKMIFPR